MDSLPRTPSWRRYLRFWRASVAADVDDELRFHLESRIEALVATGLPEAEAAARAAAEMGDVTAIRDRLTRIDRRVMRRRTTLEQCRVLVLELSYALRRLRQSPTFTIAATLTLAIAIGATTSVFGLADGVLLEPFPYHDPSRLLWVSESNAGLHLPRYRTSPADFLAFRSQSTAFSGLVARTFRPVIRSGAQEPEALYAEVVTPDYFPVYGIRPVLGRGLSSDSNATEEVVLGHGYWQRRLGSDPSVIGKTLTLDGHPYTVVGVMPPGMPEEAYKIDLWTRLRFTAADVQDHGHSLEVQGRLAPGRSEQSALHELNTIADRLAQANPQSNAGWSVVTFPVLDGYLAQVRPALLMLLGAAACVLLVGVTNLANLFLVRLLAREREMALRTALGATRGRLARELSAEGILLGAVAATLGIALALIGVRVLISLSPTNLPRLDQVSVSPRVAAVSIAVSIGAVLIFGLLPAWRVSHGDLDRSLKDGARGSSSAHQQRLQSGLVVAQVVVAVVLLTGTGLLVKGVARVLEPDPGFRPDGVLTGLLSLSHERYSTPEREHEFVSQVERQLAALPGVLHASVSTWVPGSGGFQAGFTVVGDPPPDTSNIPIADLVCATPDYFATIGLSLRRGRGILGTDRGTTQKVAIVDDALARQYFGDRDPVGKELVREQTDTLLIVGQAASIVERRLLKDSLPALYIPYAQCPYGWPVIAVRTGVGSIAQATAVQRAVASVDPTAAVWDFESLSARMMEGISTTRLATFLASLFAAIAVALAVVGIYSVLTYVVGQRQREIAVRIALGAQPGSVVREVVQRGLVLAGAGMVVGSLVAWMLTRALAALFLGVSPHDPAIFAGVAVTFAVVALVATSIPAFRTTRVNPVVALTAT